MFEDLEISARLRRFFTVWKAEEKILERCPRVVRSGDVLGAAF